MTREAFRRLAGRSGPGRNPCRKGVTLVEILVVTTVMTLLAAITLPVYKLIQQRERERRLGEILDNVRASLFGSQSPDEYHSYTEGYQIYVVRKLQGMGLDPASYSYAIATGAALGLLRPQYPSKIENAVGDVVTIPTATSGASVNVTINRRFLRRIPPHPFVGWFPNAHWEFEAKVFPSGSGRYLMDTAASESAQRLGVPIWPVGSAFGVADIKSKGAGILLDGRNSDNL